jgi:hypothetical protein
MKNLNKRNKIFLGVIGAVIIIVIVGLSLGITGSLPLQGSSGPYLFPYRGVCLLPNGTGNVSLENYSGVMNPKWSISDGTLAKILTHGSNGASVQAFTNQGQTTIKATGSFGRTLGTTGILVREECPPVINMAGVGTTTTLKTSLTGGQWISFDPNFVTVDQNGVIKAVAATGINVEVGYRVGGKFSATTIVLVCSEGGSGCPSAGWGW